MMSNAGTIIWFRLDLRLEDHPALAAASDRGGPVIPLFIWSPEEEKEWAPGEASQWWLHQSLEALDASLRKRKSRLILRKGKALDVLKKMTKETGADAVYWSRRYEPAILGRDEVVKKALCDEGLDAKSFNSSLLFEPWKVKNKQGNPYKVFTPYYKECLKHPEPRDPLPVPPISSPPSWPKSVNLEDLALEPPIDWAGGLDKAWTPGETGAQEELERFLDEALHAYPEGRDIPCERGTSRMSPYLHFGEMSPRVLWHTVKVAAEAGPKRGLIRGSEEYLRQLVWREFSYHLLFHFPHTTDTPLRPEFGAFPWDRSKKRLKAWQTGNTGYPIVDAGMRQLWQTGWMHNRVRMIVGSFLVKHLRLPWQEGAKWFWDTLVDADLANNTMGWQWIAGSGADAAPYFRIFNPIIQGEKFDPEGEYVKRFIPELKEVPKKYIHKPWEAPPDVLEEAGVMLSETYPGPVVDHAEARDSALAAYNAMKG